jgi:4-phytase/acid phosphatase
MNLKTIGQKVAVYGAFLVLAGIAIDAMHYVGNEAAGRTRPLPLKLTKIVILMRHGVRSPTQSQKKLSQWSNRKWPTWTEAPGDLTKKGFVLARMMAEGIRKYYGTHGLPMKAGCAAHNDVYVYADNMERTIATGRAVFEGFYPGCRLAPAHMASGKDPLFHAIKMSACPVDNKIATRKVKRKLATVLAKSHQLDVDLAKMRVVLCPKSGNRKEVCGLSRRTKVISAKHGAVHGALHVASAVGEAFLMEYAEGKPLEQVAWGDVRSVHAMKAMLYPHNVYSAITRREAYIANHGGTLLVQAIDLLLGGSRQPKSNKTAPAPYRRAKVVILIGHDVNIAHVAAMMNMRWVLRGQPDMTPPDMALAFDLYRNKGGGPGLVGVRLFYQTLASMRKASLGKGKARPLMETLTLKGCNKGPQHDLCTVSQFQKIARQHMVPGCRLQSAWLQ